MLCQVRAYEHMLAEVLHNTYEIAELAPQNLVNYARPWPQLDEIGQGGLEPSTRSLTSRRDCCKCLQALDQHEKLNVVLQGQLGKHKRLHLA